MERFARQAANALSQVLSQPVSAGQIEVPHDAKLGDFAFPCFRLAKEMGKAPKDASVEIVSFFLLVHCWLQIMPSELIASQ